MRQLGPQDEQASSQVQQTSSQVQQAVNDLKAHAEVAILCGGLGKRLGGVQKGAIVHQGSRLIDRLSLLGQQLGTRILWVEKTSNLLPDPYGFVDQRLTDDALGGMAGAIITALKASKSEWLWVFACDLPLLEVHHLGSLAQQALNAVNSCQGCAFIEKGRPQPLSALWRTSCYEELSHFIQDGGSLSRFLSTHGALIPLEPGNMIKRQGFTLSPLFNLNTPDDLQVLKRLQS